MPEVAIGAGEGDDDRLSGKGDEESADCCLVLRFVSGDVGGCDLAVVIEAMVRCRWMEGWYSRRLGGRAFDVFP